jgi:hypothetical protein
MVAEHWSCQRVWPALSSADTADHQVTTGLWYTCVYMCNTELKNVSCKLNSLHGLRQCCFKCAVDCVHRSIASSMGGTTSMMETAVGLSDFAQHVLRQICSQEWVLERCLQNPEELCDTDMLLDSMLTPKQVIICLVSRFQVLVVGIRFRALWDVTLSRSANRSQHFEGL